MEKLSQILWRERELLESLLFHLDVERLVLSSGRTRWLARAADDVEAVLQSLRETEILRSVVADEAAGALGLSHSSSLRSLAESLDEPWKSIMIDHRDAFLLVSREIQALAETNRELLTFGLRSARETLMGLGEEGVQGYRPDGAAVLERPTPRLVDRSL
ncbi:flagellar export chaperone FlgN [Dermatophilaceae bacterium Soc4.6]